MTKNRKGTEMTTTTTDNPRNLEVVFFGLNGYAVVEPGEGLGASAGRVVSPQYRTEAEAEADLAERLAFDNGDLADLLAEPATPTPAGPTLRPTRFRAYRRSQDLIAEAHFLADTPGATPVRIHIRRNAYDHQSYAYAELAGGATLLTEDPMALELAAYTYATAPAPAVLEAVARRDVLAMAWDVAEVLGATLHPDTEDLLEGK